MSGRRRAEVRAFSFLAGAVLLMASSACGQTMPAGPPAADQSVTDQSAAMPAPAYAEDGPVVLFDIAHGNRQGMSGEYAAFAQSLGADGYEVRPGDQRLNAPGALDGVDVLIIASPGLLIGGPNPSPFQTSEVRAIEAWVAAGGSLLLVSPGWPTGPAAQPIAHAFGVGFGQGEVFRLDPAGTGLTSDLTFTRDGGGLGDHPILSGRGTGDAVVSVTAHGGQSLSGPEGASALLILAPSDREARNRAAIDALNSRAAAGEASAADLAQASPAVRPALALAFEHGQGRVVVLGSPALLGAGPADQPDRENDAERFVLNVLHWLSRLY